MRPLLSKSYKPTKEIEDIIRYFTWSHDCDIRYPNAISSTHRQDSECVIEFKTPAQQAGAFIGQAVIVEVEMHQGGVEFEGFSHCQSTFVPKTVPR